jgi:hypothetical protein
MWSPAWRIAPSIGTPFRKGRFLGDEMRDFQRKISDAGRFSWNAKAGKHDDLINAIAINLWMCTALPTVSVEEWRI